jgi:Zn-dependent protease with chaperone function
MELLATYYDGRTARRHDVLLSMEAGLLRVRGELVAREEVLTALDIPGPLGNTPRLILFADGARCEIPDHAAFGALLQAAGPTPSLLAAMESRWSHAIGALLVTLGLVAAAYFWGLPHVAREVAYRVPGGALTLMDDQFLKTFDDRLLHPSKLSTARQQALSTRLEAMHLPPGARLPSRVLFRSSSQLGPNAFALPGGSVVVLDEIVELSDNDEEIIGVLAHEMGHVSERHALRQMLQGSVVALAMLWYVGDVSNVLAAAPSTLLETRYSRDFERRADAFATQMLALNGIQAARLADMLALLDQARKKSSAALTTGWPDYLSTHPNTEERIRALRGTTSIE